MPMQPRPISETSRSASFRFFMLSKPFSVEIDLPIDQLEVARGLLELSKDRLAMCLEQLQALLVRLFSPAEQLRIPADLANGHPRGAEPGQELDPLEVVLGIAAMAAAVALDGLQQAGALPVAEGVRAEPRALGRLGDAEGAGHPPRVGVRARSKSRVTSSWASTSERTSTPRPEP